RSSDLDGNYYLWGAMGAAALVGLGLAQARPDRTVMVVTGDGEQLMGLGGLATIAVAAPAHVGGGGHGGGGGRPGREWGARRPPIWWSWCSTMAITARPACNAATPGGVSISP